MMSTVKTKNWVHGMYGTPTYNSWTSMKRRCRDPKFPAYPHYGGSGITYCEAWEKFVNFYADMGDRPDGTSLDRRDNSKGYDPENCRWSTAKEQTLNRRQTVFHTLNGITLCARDWEIKLGMSRGALYYRLKSMSIEEALTRPLKDVGRHGKGAA